jgi:adenine-specific DNA-methyltransferase
LSAILNTAIVDNYFRALNGNTQVNATDIRILPFPSLKDIRRIGQAVRKRNDYATDFVIDEIVGKILGIDKALLSTIYEESDRYGQGK